MPKWNLKKIAFSIGLVPILITPLLLSSCFNQQQVQFPPKEVSLNNGGQIPGLTPLTNKVANLSFINGGYLLNNVFESQALPEKAYPGDDADSRKKWIDYQKFVSTQLFNAILVGSGANVDGVYTTGQLLRSLLLNQTMLVNDEAFKAFSLNEKNNWRNFLILLTNTLNQSSGTFVDSNDQYLFELSNLDIAVSVEGETEIPFSGVLSTLTKGAHDATNYETSISLTFSGLDFHWFDFAGNKKPAPKNDSIQASVLKKQGYFLENDQKIADYFSLEFKTPIIFTYEQYVYDKTKWEDVNTTFPTPLNGSLVDATTEEFKPEVAIFKGLKINGVKITNELNIKITDAANKAQQNLVNSKPLSARKELQFFSDQLFGPNVYQENSPVTSIFKNPVGNFNE